MTACFLSNISTKYYKNPSMLSRVIAKNVGDVFFETQCMCQTPVMAVNRRWHQAAYVLSCMCWYNKTNSNTNLNFREKKNSTSLFVNCYADACQKTAATVAKINLQQPHILQR